MLEIYLNALLNGISLFSGVKKEFKRYKSNRLTIFYSNYLDYCITTIFDDGLLDEFLEEYGEQFHVPKQLVKKLDLLRIKIEDFYKECKDLDDPILIRCKQWDEIIPLAKACEEGLQKMLKEVKWDP